MPYISYQPHQWAEQTTNHRDTKMTGAVPKPKPKNPPKPTEKPAEKKKASK